MTIYAVIDADGNEVAVYESLEKAERAMVDGGSLVQRMGNLTSMYGQGVVAEEPHNQDARAYS